MLLSDCKKDFITQIFINLATIDYRIKFLKWNIKNINIMDLGCKNKEKKVINDCLERIKEARQQNKKIQLFISNGSTHTL
jgi:hypothetical protein